MSDDDIHLREKLVQTGFSQDDERIHSEAMAYLNKAVAAGQPWKKVTDGLRVQDAELKRIILDDFLKITLAERHFQGGEGLKQIAKSLAAPMELLVQAKTAMIAEVQKVSHQAYLLTRPGGSGSH